MATSIYEVPHPPGSNPPAETTTFTEGGQTMHFIHDQRTTFVRDLIPSLGGIYDDMKKTATFTDANREGFDEAVGIISGIPYYELPRAYAQYANAQIKADRDATAEANRGKPPADRQAMPHQGLETMLRSAFANDPRSARLTPRLMAATNEAYEAGVKLVNQVKVATPDETKQISAALEGNGLDDQMLATIYRREGEAKLTTDNLREMLDNGELDRPLARKILNLTTEINPKQVQGLSDAVREGRLTDRDFAEFGATSKQFSKISAANGYTLADLAKKRATGMERDLVQTLSGMGYSDRKIGHDLLAITSKDANAFISAKVPLLTPEQSAIFNAVKTGSPVPGAAAAVADSLDSDAAALAPGVAVTPFEPAKIATIRVLVASPEGVIGWTNEDRTALGKLSARTFSPELKANSPLRDDLLVVNMSNGRASTTGTAQTDPNHAIAERLGVDFMRRTGFAGTQKSLGPNETPAQGNGTLLFKDRTNNLAVLATKEGIVTIDGGALASDVTMLQPASYDLGGEGATAVKATAPKRTATRSR